MTQSWPTLAEAARVWARVAAMSFGGPAGQIAVMHRIVVDEKRWVGDRRFLHALNFCMLLPGPEAMQLAAYLGWLMHGVRGALIAGGLFILPGALAMLVLSGAYAVWGEVGLIGGLFFGLKAAVLAVVVQAVLRIGKRALGSAAMVAIAGTSLVAIAVLNVPFPVIVGAAALVGWLGHRAGLAGFDPHRGKGGTGNVADAETLLGDARAPAASGAYCAGFIALAAWLVPVAGLMLAAPDAVWTDIATFFSRMAVVTFGGAYAVLAYVAQEAVGNLGWLRPGEMMDGLGLAETTPGPLVLVLEFVGFIAGWRESGLAGGVLGAFLSLWVTFVPCFAWIFLGAPHIERLRENRALGAALAAVTAAVVGVILNLALWFGWHFIWPAGRFDPLAASLAAVALVLVVWRNLGIGTTLALCGAAGVVAHLAGLV